MDFISTFKEYLKEQSLPFTLEREKIVKLISEFKHHFTIDDLLLFAVEKKLDISRATLYRTVQLLMDSGLLNKFQGKDNIPFYESLYDKGLHYHMICTRCGVILEFSSSDIESISADICRIRNFTPGFMTLKMYGICENCK
jgi:Fur family ferric uptake transcriptional regulator